MVSVVLHGLDPLGVKMKGVAQRFFFFWGGGGTAVDTAADTKVSDIRRGGVNMRCKQGYCAYDPPHPNKQEYVGLFWFSNCPVTLMFPSHFILHLAMLPFLKFPEIVCRAPSSLKRKHLEH